MLPYLTVQNKGYELWGYQQLTNSLQTLFISVLMATARCLKPSSLPQPAGLGWRREGNRDNWLRGAFKATPTPASWWCFAHLPEALVQGLSIFLLVTQWILATLAFPMCDFLKNGWNFHRHLLLSQRIFSRIECLRATGFVWVYYFIYWAFSWSLKKESFLLLSAVMVKHTFFNQGRSKCELSWGKDRNLTETASGDRP